MRRKLETKERDEDEQIDEFSIWGASAKWPNEERNELGGKRGGIAGTGRIGRVKKGRNANPAISRCNNRPPCSRKTSRMEESRDIALFSGVANVAGGRCREELCCVHFFFPICHPRRGQKDQRPVEYPDIKSYDVFCRITGPWVHSIKRIIIAVTVYCWIIVIPNELHMKFCTLWGKDNVRSVVNIVRYWTKR